MEASVQFIPPRTCVLHLGHMLLLENEKIFLARLFAIKKYNLLYCCVLTPYFDKKPNCWEERLCCSCYYWIWLFRCISFWQIKAFKVIKVITIVGSWLNFSAAFFQTTLSGKTQTIVHLQHRFSLGGKGEGLGAVFAFRTTAGAQFSDLLYIPWNVICCANQEKSYHHILPSSHCAGAHYLLHALWLFFLLVIISWCF